MDAETIVQLLAATLQIVNKALPALATSDKEKIAALLAQSNAAADLVHEKAQGL